MKKNGYTGMEMLIVIVVLGIATLGVLVTTSYAFKDHSTDYYEETEHLIVHQAVIYGDTLEDLKTEGNKVITLDEMIEAGYYVADDSNGNVIDPRNSKSTLNDLKIKLTYTDGKVNASIIENE